MKYYKLTIYYYAKKKQIATYTKKFFSLEKALDKVEQHIWTTDKTFDIFNSKNAHLVLSTYVGEIVVNKINEMGFYYHIDEINFEHHINRTHWFYLKDGDFPPKDDYYLVSSNFPCAFVAWFDKRQKKFFDENGEAEIPNVYAWTEVVKRAKVRS